MKKKFKLTTEQSFMSLMTGIACGYFWSQDIHAIVIGVLAVIIVSTGYRVINLTHKDF